MQNNKTLFLKLFILSTLILGQWCLSATELFVSTSGDDNSSGSFSAPLATFRGAVDKLRSISGSAGGVTVTFAGGVYRIDSTIELNAVDAASEGERVLFRAAPGESVIIKGETPISSANFSPVTAGDPLWSRIPDGAKGSLFKIDLTPYNLTRLTPFADVFTSPDTVLQLYYNGEAMNLARWPDFGEQNSSALTGYTTMGGVWVIGDSVTPGVFSYRDNRHAKWDISDGLWLFGAWRVSWSYQGIRVAKIDTNLGRVEFAAGIVHGIGSKYHRTTGPPYGSGSENYYAINVLEEITAKEYYIHFPSRTLYFFPPGGTLGAEISFGDSSGPMILLNGTSGITLKGFHFTERRMQAIIVQNSEKCKIEKCSFDQLKGTAIEIHGGAFNEVHSSVFSNLGRGAILVNGGNRTNLTPAGHTVYSNTIFRFGQIDKLASGVEVGLSPSCGIRVAFNEISDGPCSGVRYNGNDIFIEYNKLYNLGKEADDYGAVYSWGKWTDTGVKIRYNHIYKCPRIEGIFLDGADSGAFMTGNVISNTLRGFKLNGGRMNYFSKNTIMDSVRDSIVIADVGVSSHYEIEANAQMLWRDLKSVPVTSPIWTNRFPLLANLSNDHPERPYYNYVTNNRLIKPGSGYTFLKYTWGSDSNRYFPQSVFYPNNTAANSTEWRTLAITELQQRFANPSDAEWNTLLFGEPSVEPEPEETPPSSEEPSLPVEAEEPTTPAEGETVSSLAWNQSKILKPGEPVVFILSDKMADYIKAGGEPICETIDLSGKSYPSQWFLKESGDGSLLLERNRNDFQQAPLKGIFLFRIWLRFPNGAVSAESQQEFRIFLSEK